jgi:ATP adenylyltransferase
MELLWAPWRHAYVSEPKGPGEDCIFCDKPSQIDDESNLIVYRSSRVFVMLNAFPYNPGHLLIAPYAHVADLEAAAGDDLTELILVARRAEMVLRSAMRPDGFNLGMNLGIVAGAGVAGHVHLHVVPRWAGDTNFMPVISDTHVISQSLQSAFEVLHAEFAR